MEKQVSDRYPPQTGAGSSLRYGEVNTRKTRTNAPSSQYLTSRRSYNPLPPYLLQEGVEVKLKGDPGQVSLRPTKDRPGGFRNIVHGSIQQTNVIYVQPYTATLQKV